MDNSLHMLQARSRGKYCSPTLAYCTVLRTNHDASPHPGYTQLAFVTAFFYDSQDDQGNPDFKSASAPPELYFPRASELCHWTISACAAMHGIDSQVYSTPDEAGGWLPFHSDGKNGFKV